MTDNNNIPVTPVNTTSTENQKIDIIGEKTAENYAIISELLKTNLKQTKIAELTGYTPEHLSVLKKKLSKIQLVTPKRIKKAIKSIEYISDVNNLNSNDKIKCADVINAAKIFLDRQYPENKINLGIDNSQKINNIQINFVKKVSDENLGSE